MKVILFKSVQDLGEEDSLINVSEGYARNYLIPKKLAGLATPSALEALKKRKAEKEKVLAEKKAQFMEQAEKLSALELTILVDAGEGGKLFGSVTSQDIASEVAKLGSFDLDRKKVELAEPIKVVGTYDVPVKIFQDIKAKLKVKVEARK
jgi:large subunit ribosomal protein L9